MNIINKMVWTIQRSQPGSWNGKYGFGELRELLTDYMQDLDMLEVGNGGMTDNEYKL